MVSRKPPRSNSGKLLEKIISNTNKGLKNVEKRL